MFRFLHASDLHLGAAFEGVRLISPDAAEALHQATYRALERIVRLAIERDASFVVLAGDLCNRADGNLRAELALRRAAQSLHEAGIRTFVVYGNHDFLDPGRPDLDWPPSTRVFLAEETEPVVVELKSGPTVVVHGLSYSRREESANLAQRFPEPPGGAFSVAVLHTACGAIEGHARYAPCSLQDLVGRGYDYWALGHVHRHSILRESAPTIVYSGNPQGLNPNETGPRGCCLVSVDGSRNVGVEFCETDAVRWFALEVSIEGLSREQELLDRLDASLAEVSASLSDDRAGIARIRLTGRGPLHRFLRDPARAEHLREVLLEKVAGLPSPLWTESVVDRTRPEVDLGERERAEDFLGQFLRIAGEISADPETLASAWRKVQEAMSASHLAALRRTGLALDSMEIAAVAELLDQARILGADMLLREER